MFMLSSLIHRKESSLRRPWAPCRLRDSGLLFFSSTSLHEHLIIVLFNLLSLKFTIAFSLQPLVLVKHKISQQKKNLQYEEYWDINVYLRARQSRIQSPQTLLLVDSSQERLCGKTMQAVTEQPMKKNNIPVFQSLSWRLTAGQRAWGLWVPDWELGLMKRYLSPAPYAESRFSCSKNIAINFLWNPSCCVCFPQNKCGEYQTITPERPRFTSYLKLYSPLVPYPAHMAHECHTLYSFNQQLHKPFLCFAEICPLTSFPTYPKGYFQIWPT